MRRMRELTYGHYVAIALPVLGAAFGIHYLIKHPHRPTGSETAALKPSQYKAEKGSRKPASARGDKNRDARHEGQSGEEIAGSEPAAQFAETAGYEASRAPSAVLEGASNDAVDTGKECAAVEYRGDGPEQTKVTKAEWAAVMDQFHSAKSSLTSWLNHHRREFPDATFAMMEREVKDLKIQRPPAADEPDLAWRGIGIYTQGNEAEPMIKIGGGFVKLASKRPARAKFEMTRLVAQSWAPCEMARASGPNGGDAVATWNPLLKCLGVTEAQNCAQGTYSESGWAVSTTVAAAVSPPGCQIKAFASPELAKCMKQIPLAAGRSVASASESAHSDSAHGESH